MKEETKKAVALRYEKDKDSAPKVVAKGRGWIAEKNYRACKTSWSSFKGR